MKKITLTVSAFLAIIIIGELMMNGREDNSSQYYDIAKNNDILNDGDGVIREVESNKDTYEENPEKAEDAYNDLVYRKYSWGCDLEEGYDILIEKNRVIGEVDNVQSIVILLNNGVYKEFDFDDGDIEFTIEKGGNYVFLAIDPEGNSVDIISIVKVYKSADGGVMPLG